MQIISFTNFETKNRQALRLSDIIYATPEGRHCRIVTIHGDYISAECFKAIKALLTAKYFCDCHGSYRINTAYVRAYTATTAELGMGDVQYTVYVSRRYYRAFRLRLDSEISYIL